MLKLHQVSKTFNPGTINEKKALKSIDLHLKPGDFVTVIGGNGAGKSTMLNAVAGVWPVDEGSVVIDGTDVTGMPEHVRAKYIGRVFQEGRKRGLRWGVTNAEREEYHEKLKILGLGLEDRLTAKVGLLSGGQRQALTLLMAALRRPKLLLLDEHTAALDPATAKKVLEITDMLIEQNQLTTLMITHNMKDAIRHGNRLIMMNEGRIIFDVSGEEKSKLTKADLMDKFAEIAGAGLESDEILLS